MIADCSLVVGSLLAWKWDLAQTLQRFEWEKSSSLCTVVVAMLVIKCWLLWIWLAPTVYWLLHWRHIAWRNRRPADDLDHLAFPRHSTTPMPSWDSFHCCHLSTDTQSRVMHFAPSTQLDSQRQMIRVNPAMVSVERLAGWQCGSVRPSSIGTGAASKVGINNRRRYHKNENVPKGTVRHGATFHLNKFPDQVIRAGFTLYLPQTLI